MLIIDICQSFQNRSNLLELSFSLTQRRFTSHTVCYLDSGQLSFFLDYTSVTDLLFNFVSTIDPVCTNGGVIRFYL